MKPELLDLLETSLNTSPTLTSPTTSPAKVLFNSKQKNNNSGSTRARAQLPNRKSPPLQPFFENLEDES